jgi:putative DNA primase/helicase
MPNKYFNLSQGETVSPAAPINTAPAAQDPPPNPAGQTVAYTVFKNEKDNVPEAGQRTWADFSLAMQHHTARKTKEGTGAFSPVTFREGTKRGNDGVEAITMAVFDVDGGVTPDAIKSILGGFAHVLHSTWSHTSDKPSYRVIVPFTTPVPKNDWPQTWARLNLFLGGINDPATKDPARIYYLPSHPEGRDDFFVEVGEGKPLDVADLPELPIEIKAQIQSAINSNVNNVKIEGIEEIPRDLGPEAGLHEVCNRCVFMQQVSQPENQNTVSEPHWKAMISNAVCFDNAEDWIHQASCHYDGYSEAETNKGIQRFRDSSYGPTTCQRIQTLGFTGCPAGGCKTPTGKVTKAPAGLGSWAMQQQLATKDKLSKKDHVNNIVDKFNGLLHYVNHEPYSYKDGHWPMLDEQVDVTQVIAHYLGEGVSRCGINELLFLVQTFQANAEAAVTPDLNLLCLLNGTLDLRTGELIEHRPEHNLKCQINCIWDPSEPCYRWDQFLDEIVDGGPDCNEKLQLLQEWFGYCLIPDNSQHKFLWLVGAGGNGKSVLLDVLRHLVGPSNVSDAHIERLGDKGVRAELENKLVNISAEMGAEATIADGYLKSIVAGDFIEAERKFKDSFSFRPTVRLVGSTNHLPRLLDLSDGFFRRAMILQFNRQFLDGERDTKLTEKLVAELPGILAWAVEGLKNLRKRGYFVIPSSSIEALNQYRLDSDPERMYFDECLVEDPTGEGMTPNSLYADYVEWCRRSGHRAKSKINFGKRLSEFGIGSRRGHSSNYWFVKKRILARQV